MDNVLNRPQFIVGTAGHIDHGKSALVKALTGRDPDTLPEEKSRGMTIELGFVFLDAPESRKQIVFIDVPGHERLVRTMVAGAASIDAVVLVIAADEGIKEQTSEHFDILNLLGLDRGIIALTKSDLVDAERREAVGAEIRSFVAGSFLADAPVMPVSSTTGQGVEEIRRALVDLAGKAEKRPEGGFFRMPIDRVFTRHGFGTVIAGTVLSGSVRPGDAVTVYPEILPARVRGVQVHNQSVAGAGAGERAALNITDLAKEQLRRGQTVAAPDTLIPVNRLDGRLYVLKNYGLTIKNRTRVHLHIGTDEVISRLILLEGDTLSPGETALVQFFLESPVVARPRDRFVIRLFSPVRTIGGGIVVDAQPGKHGRRDAAAITGLKNLESGLEDAVAQSLRQAAGPRTAVEIAVRIGADTEAVREAAEALAGRGKLVPVSGGKYVHKDAYDKLGADFLRILEEYYSANPYRLAVPSAHVRSRLSAAVDKETYESVLAVLLAGGKVLRRDVMLSLPGGKIRWKTGEEELAERVRREFLSSGFTPSLEEDVMNRLGIPLPVFRNLMTALIDLGDLVRLDEKVTYHRDFLEKAKQLVLERAGDKDGISVAQLRDALNVSRKYALAILEYFDRTGVTRRSGDSHALILPSFRQKV